MYLSVKELSAYLSIKASTLYSWAAKGLIPNYKVHGVIRFKKKDIDTWVESFRQEKVKLPSLKKKNCSDVDILIASAKKEVYNSFHGKPGPVKVSGRR